MPTITAGVRHLSTRTAVIDFFDLVMNEQLLFPAVVVTRSTTEPGPHMPLDKLHALVDGMADVFYIDSPCEIRDVVQRSATHTVDDVNVYGGATRVFPAGRWDDGRMFLARNAEEGSKRAEQIARHLKDITRPRGSLSYSTSTPAPEAHDAVHRASASIRLVEVEAENSRLRQQVTRLSASAPKSSPKPKAPSTGPVPVQKANRRMFADAGDEIRFRIMVLWAEQTTPQEKQESPLPRYTFGSTFADSLDELAGTSPVLFDKVARSALRVLLGQDRDGHKLDISGKVREDGAVPWRTYVEQKTASARRLHYWRLPGGSIELSRVVLHDDYAA